MTQRLTGALLASTLGGLMGSLMRWGVNPWFVDEPLSFGLFTLVPLMIAGWWLGGRLPANRLPGGRGPLFWAIASAGLFGLACVPPSEGTLSTRLMVVGIDGATWDVVKQAEMPALTGLKEDGRSGTLMAEEPLFSPLLWSTLATGQRPEAHGIRGLKVRADQALAARFWDIAREAGLEVGLYKWLVSWPPPDESIPGFTVPAWLAADATTHPADLSWVKELELSNRTHRVRIQSDRGTVSMVLDGLTRGLRWSTVWSGLTFAVRDRLVSLPPNDREAFLRRMRLKIDRDTFSYAVHRHDPDVATFTVYLTDAVSHTHWSDEGGDAVLDAYELADEVLGDILSHLGPDATVLVLSDHGFRPASDGHGAHGVVPKIGQLQEELEGALGAVEIVRVGRKLVVTPEDVIPSVQFEDAISTLRFDDGTPLYRSESHQGGRAWSLSIDRVPPDHAEWASIAVAGVSFEEFAAHGRDDKGEHDPAGIAVLAGPQVGTEPLGAVSQLDVTPTILSLIGLPAAKDMPGQSWVPETVPRVDSYRALAPGGAEREEPVDRERLRSLGYVD